MRPQATAPATEHFTVSTCSQAETFERLCGGCSLQWVTECCLTDDRRLPLSFSFSIHAQGPDDRVAGQPNTSWATGHCISYGTLHCDLCPCRLGGCSEPVLCYWTLLGHHMATLANLTGNALTTETRDQLLLQNQHFMQVFGHGCLCSWPQDVCSSGHRMFE